LADTSYGEAHAHARKLLSQARLRDPGEHFPYKTADSKAALRRKSMGPDGDGGHDVTGADFISARIIEASEAYIAAQAAFLEDPSRANRSAYAAATDDLVAARRTHRRNRVDANGQPVGGVVGLTDASRPTYMRGARLRRVGEE
jgi:hypothetical protein